MCTKCYKFNKTYEVKRYDRNVIGPRKKWLPRNFFWSWTWIKWRNNFENIMILTTKTKIESDFINLNKITKQINSRFRIF
jgi:hypothetical protein